MTENFGKHNPSCRIAIVALAILTLIWGYNWVVVKVGLQYVGPFDFAALRGICGVVGLFLALVVLRKPLRPRAVPGTILLGFLQISVFLALTNFAMVSGGAGKTAVLVYTMPFWTILFAWPVFGERVKGFQWLAVSLALIGLVLILEPWKLQATLVSNVLATLGGVSWAASVIVAKKLRHRGDVQLLSLTAWQMLFGVIPLIVIALAVPSRPIEWSGYFIFALAYAGILATVVGWFLWLYVLNHLSAGTASINSLAIPIVAVLCAWIELGETPSPSELAGMLTIAIALLIISFLNIRKFQKKAPLATNHAN
jgi:drug/metabolite transporter (DMT)-like permease